jgi:cysteine synthase A
VPIYADIAATVGRTPVVRINRMNAGPGELIAKLESRNPVGSIKDRVAVSLIEDAEKRGALKPGGTIVEPTSGNTGLGLAFVAAARGYKLTLTMPETMSRERVALLRFLGATIERTPGSLMKEAVKRAEEIARETPGAVLLQQFENPANSRAHYESTAPELWADVDGKLDYFVAGVGTGGTISGVGRFLKEKKSACRIVAVEPASTAALSGGRIGPNVIQGIGAGFVPKILDRSVIDEVITVTDDQAFTTARRLAREEGILSGISSGAAMAAALQVAARPEAKGKRVVVILPDTGERYVTTRLFAGLLGDEA